MNKLVSQRRTLLLHSRGFLMKIAMIKLGKSRPEFQEASALEGVKIDTFVRVDAVAPALATYSRTQGQQSWHLRVELPIPGGKPCDRLGPQTPAVRTMNSAFPTLQGSFGKEPHIPQGEMTSGLVTFSCYQQ